MRMPIILALLASLSFVAAALRAEEDHHLHSFQRQRLTDVYFSEGANIGDINGDGKMDVVHGPFWFEGPAFTKKREIYPARPQDRNRYANSFFSWVRDFNGDGRNDVFAVGFPGTPAHVYENPGVGKRWIKHEVFDWVSNESPHFVDLVGDDRPELVCTRDGVFGYAEVNWKKPWEPWRFTRISEQVAAKRFGHGLGVGDVNGDDRLDLLAQNGWFEQPKSREGNPRWRFHPFQFARAGGAEMYAYDVDGDGDNDVITSLAAHDYGLAWYEQVKTDGKIDFRRHLIMGKTPEENRYGVVFTELHSVNLADIDGDGLKDIVTGKTYWSHHRQSPLWNAGAVVYWFKLERSKDGVDWVPHRADDDSGIGRQVIVGDVNGDKLPDIVVGGMKGCHVLIHRREKVDARTHRLARPQPRKDLVAGLTPPQAARQMTPPPGFQVQLAAGEPMVHQPVAMAFDERGRLWVAEAHTYPRRAPEGQGKDKIIILEDTDLDGAFDKRTVFMEGLNLVSGMEVGFGGVWVGAAPYLMFIPDRNRDDRPDAEPQVLLDGFGYQDTHETLNTFNWGPDGWLYGCHGVFTHSLIGKPGAPKAERTPMNAAVWRYHPVRHAFEIFAYGTSNPWGVDFNDQGQAFATACVIPHLWHVVQGARYQRQGGRHFNPYVFDDIKTIADHSHYVGNIRDHAWWGHEPLLRGDTSAAGGGHAHCGAMVYLGDNWPARYRNQIFMNNVHGNRVNCDLLERRGSGFVGHHGPDFLKANDRWFRGINLRCAPDGSVYLIDWYDKNACHRNNPEIWDRTNGRVYRLVYGAKKPARVDLSKLSNGELIRLHEHKNDWYVRTARRVLQHRAASSPADGRLSIPLDEGMPVDRQLRYLWTRHAVGALDESTATALLDSKSEYVRGWAIQLMLEDRKATDELVGRLSSLAVADPSPVVRLYLASALQRLDPARRWSIAEGLMSHAEDANDHNLPLLIWYGVEPLVAENPRRAMALASRSKIPRLTQFITRRAASDAKGLDFVIQSIPADVEGDQPLLVLDEMLRAFEGRVDIPMPKTWSTAYERLVKSPRQEVRDRADQLAVLFGDRRIFPRMRELLSSRTADLKKRQQALAILVRGRDKLAPPALQKALSEKTLRGPALRALAAHDDPRTPAAIVAQYAELTEAERRDAINTLTARPSFAMALFDAVERKQVPRTDVHAFNVRQMVSFRDKKLTERIRKIWGEFRETSADKKKRIGELKGLLDSPRLAAADLPNGRRLFSKSCASCHTLFGLGGKVGPDITGSNRANLDYILENIIDPSAVLGKDYRMTILRTDDGRAISGLVLKETDSALTVRTINDTVIVPLDEIEERKLSDQSMMPERLLEPLKPKEVVDLIAYLGSARQVALRGPRAPIDPKTKRAPGAIEGETMKILAKSRGQARGQSMADFRGDRWSGVDHLWWTGARPGDRLTLELPVAKSGVYDVQFVLTRARDYGVVQLSIDGKPLGGPIDLYDPQVVTTGVLGVEGVKLEAGARKLGVTILGANPRADKGYMFGLDYIRLAPK